MGDHILNIVTKLRKERRVTQEELAEALKVSRQTIIAIEKGNYIPSLLLGMRLSSYFKKKVEEVFLYKNEK